MTEISVVHCPRLGRHMYGIASDYDQTVIDIVKNVPGMSWSRSEKVWTGYSDAVYIAAKHLAAAGMTVADADELTPVFDPAPNTGSYIVSEEGLREYQKEDVHFAVRKAAEGCLLALFMGGGKTVITLRALKALRTPALVVCPNSARGIWGDGEDSQVKRWWPEAWPPRMLSGTKPGDLLNVLDPPKLTVIHYDILHAWKGWIAASGIKAVAFDEIHALASEKSRRSKSAKEVAREMIYRVGLSGTPLTNRPRDLWNVIDTLSPDRMGWFFSGDPRDGRRESFSTRYCNAFREQVTPTKAAWIFDGKSHEDELAERLQFFMRRRTAESVALQLPAMTRQIIEVEVGKPRTPHLTAGGKVDKRALRRELDILADKKLPAVLDLLVEDHKAGGRIVCFTFRRAVAEHLVANLKAAGIKASFIHGEVPQKRRDEIIRSRPEILVAGIDVSAVAIDLTWWNEIVFAELTYEPHELLQAEARVIRFGQVEHVMIKYVLARGSVDNLIKTAVISKLQTFNKIIGGLEGAQKDFEGNKAKSSEAALKRLFDQIMKRQKEETDE